MNWAHVETQLERSFTARPRRFGSTLVVERRKPFRLAAAMNETLSEDESDEWGDLKAWPGSVSELLEQHGVEERRMLRWYWDGLGPTSWVAGLVLIGNGRRRYLTYWNEIDSYVAVAAIEPWDEYPDLRRQKAEQLSAAPFERGAAQAVVWGEVRGKSLRHKVASPTLAQSDIFEQREKDLDALRGRFSLQPGQSGAVFAAGGRICLDYVSRPDAFARLYPKLLNGYLLDTIDWLDRTPAEIEDLVGFYLATEAAPRSRRPSAALGDDVRFRGCALVGSGLELKGEVLQWCAFSSDAEVEATTIASPSRRHA
jgi:hypothetical protein